MGLKQVKFIMCEFNKGIYDAKYAVLSLATPFFLEAIDV
jgi:hypothetical protein